jgi:hypothetical protein
VAGFAATRRFDDRATDGKLLLESWQKLARIICYRQKSIAEILVASLSAWQARLGAKAINKRPDEMFV